MNKLSALVLLVAVWTAPAAAQDAPGAWAPEHRALADAISTAAVWTQIGLETWHNARGPEPKRALTRQLLRNGIAIGAAELTKHVVHKTRPDGSDRKSFFSEHTELAFANAGWNVSISIPLGASVGTLRMAANKHDALDVAIGGALGAVLGRSLR